MQTNLKFIKLKFILKQSIKQATFAIKTFQNHVQKLPIKIHLSQKEFKLKLKLWQICGNCGKNVKFNDFMFVKTYNEIYMFS